MVLLTAEVDPHGCPSRRQGRIDQEPVLPAVDFFAGDLPPVLLAGVCLAAVCLAAVFFAAVFFAAVFFAAVFFAAVFFAAVFFAAVFFAAVFFAAVFFAAVFFAPRTAACARHTLIDFPGHLVDLLPYLLIEPLDEALRRGFQPLEQLAVR